MNTSDVITRIKLNLGLMGISTPFENLDDTILTILRTITVPTFSIYCPFRTTLNVNVSETEILERQNNYTKFLLPDYGNRKLLYVFDINYKESCNTDTSLFYDHGCFPVLGCNTYQDIALSNMSLNMMNVVVPKLTFKFEPPRTLFVYNAYTSNELLLDVGCEHDFSLATITESSKESFMNLALLDVKSNLYPTLKHYSEIQTAIGTINLKIDDWQDAESQRKDLLSHWDDVYHLDQQPFYYV